MNHRIAIDIDEVLVPFVKPMARWRGLKMPTQPKYEYVYREMFNISEEESRDMVETFYNTKEFINLEPIPYSRDAMYRMKRSSPKIYALSGRQNFSREKTEYWLSHHFPNVFSDVILTDSYTKDEISKADICRSLAINVLIDDNFHTCVDCMKSGVKAINFIGYDEKIYPWCYESNISKMGWQGDMLYPIRQKEYNELMVKKFWEERHKNYTTPK